MKIKVEIDLDILPASMMAREETFFESNKFAEEIVEVMHRAKAFETFKFSAIGARVSKLAPAKTTDEYGDEKMVSLTPVEAMRAASEYAKRIHDIPRAASREEFEKRSVAGAWMVSVSSEFEEIANRVCNHLRRQGAVAKAMPTPTDDIQIAIGKPGAEQPHPLLFCIDRATKGDDAEYSRLTKRYVEAGVKAARILETCLGVHLDDSSIEHVRKSLASRGSDIDLFFHFRPWKADDPCPEILAAFDEESNWKSAKPQGIEPQKTARASMRP